MNDDRSTTPPPKPRNLRNIGIAAALVVVAFSAGFAWQWTEARQARQERDELATRLVFEELENELASAVIQTANDSHEGARELMSRFFTGLQSELDRAPAEARTALAQILSRRDAVITALSRADPSSEALVTRIYMRYQVATGGPSVGIPIPPPRAGDTAPPAGTPSDSAGRGASPEAEPAGGGPDGS